MRFSRRRGRLHLRLEPAEVEVLRSLFAELAAVLNGDDRESADREAADPVLRRLFPAAYADDPSAEADFRSLTHASLRSERVDRITLCAGEIARSPDVDLSDPDTADRWIKALNDLRLALGTRLGVTEEETRVDSQDQPRVVYQWLTAVQDSVVTAVLR